LEDSSLDKIILLKHNLLTVMAYKVATWNQLDQYLVEWMFVTNIGTKVLTKTWNGPQRTSKNFSNLELLPQYVVTKSSNV
jgi:hypothetical protein